MTREPRTGRRRWALVIAGLAVLVAALLLLPDRRELELGAHRVSVTRPRGFEVVPFERSFLFRDGAVLVELKDMGTPGADPEAEAPLDEWADWGIVQLDGSSQREVAHRESLVVAERELALVETWDRLTHAQPRSFAFVRNERALLALYTRGGDPERAASAFDRILRSLRFADGDPG